MRKIYFLVLGFSFMFFILLSLRSSFAEKGKEDVKVISNEMKEMDGEVSAVNKNGIAVVYSTDANDGAEYEMYLPLEKGTNLVHKKSLDEISVGDKVRIEFEEAREENKQDKSGLSTKRRAKTITFVSAAIKKPELVEEPQNPENQEDESLGFKGLRSQ